MDMNGLYTPFLMPTPEISYSDAARYSRHGTCSALKLRHWELSKDPQEHGNSMLKTCGEKVNLVYSSPPHQRYDIVILLDTPGMVLVQRLNLGVGGTFKLHVCILFFAAQLMFFTIHVLYIPLLFCSQLSTSKIRRRVTIKGSTSTGWLTSHS